jgi:hypothetical protein
MYTRATHATMSFPVNYRFWLFSGDISSRSYLSSTDGGIWRHSQPGHFITEESAHCQHRIRGSEPHSRSRSDGKEKTSTHVGNRALIPLVQAVA